MTAAEPVSVFNLTTDTPYLALTGELWGVYCDDCGENWPRFNSTALYLAYHVVTELPPLYSVSRISGFAKQYITRNMDMVHVLLWSITYQFYPSPSGLLHWHRAHQAMVPEPSK